MKSATFTNIPGAPHGSKVKCDEIQIDKHGGVEMSCDTIKGGTQTERWLNSQNSTCTLADMVRKRQKMKQKGGCSS